MKKVYSSELSFNSILRCKSKGYFLNKETYFSAFYHLSNFKSFWATNHVINTKQIRYNTINEILNRNSLFSEKESIKILAAKSFTATITKKKYPKCSLKFFSNA